MVRRIRRHWPHTRITIRGDCHYGRHEVMTWCEANGLHYIFGLSGNVVLDQMVEPLADEVRAQRAAAQAKLVALRRAEPPVDAGWLRRAEAQANAVRQHTEVRYGAKHWRCQRRVAARIEATPKGLDIRLRRDQPGWRQCGMALQDAVLRARPDGEFHQAAQDPAGL
jgi:hypothetical protein